MYPYGPRDALQHSFQVHDLCKAHSVSPSWAFSWHEQEATINVADKSLNVRRVCVYPHAACKIAAHITKNSLISSPWHLRALSFHIFSVYPACAWSFHSKSVQLPAADGFLSSTAAIQLFDGLIATSNQPVQRVTIPLKDDEAAAAIDDHP